MDGAKASHLYPAVQSEQALEALKTERVGRSHRWRGRLWVWTWLEPPVVQILVVVANTPERPWRTDVEKGFVWTAVGHESVDPKA